MEAERASGHEHGAEHGNERIFSASAPEQRTQQHIEKPCRKERGIEMLLGKDQRRHGQKGEGAEHSAEEGGHAGKRPVQARVILP